MRNRRPRPRRIAVVSAAALLALSAAGCGSGDGEASGGAQSGGVTTLTWQMWSGSEVETTALNHLSKNPQRRKEAYEDILWALINAKEFQFND